MAEVENVQPKQSSEETKQGEQTPQIQSLGLNDHEYNKELKVCRGSFVQLMVFVNNLATTNKVASNDYQKKLYPALTTICQKIVDKYNSTFTNVSEENRAIYSQYLVGRSGKLNHPVFHRGVNRNLTYEYSQLGQILNALSNRLTFIITRDITKYQFTDENSRNSFVHLQTVAKEYHTFLMGASEDNKEGSISQEWYNTVQDARLVLPEKTISIESGEEKPRESNYKNDPPKFKHLTRALRQVMNSQQDIRNSNGGEKLGPKRDKSKYIPKQLVRELAKQTLGNNFNVRPTNNFSNGTNNYPDRPVYNRPNYRNSYNRDSYNNNRNTYNRDNYVNNNRTNYSNHHVDNDKDDHDENTDEQNENESKWTQVAPRVRRDQRSNYQEQSDDQYPRRGRGGYSGFTDRSSWRGRGRY